MTDPEALIPQQKVQLDCRFYEKEYPDTDEVVVAKVTRIEDMGAYAVLLEYSGKEGMILMSELSRRRIRSVQKLVRVGRDEYVMVLRADRDKGYIDLSKRRAGPEEHAGAENRFQKQKQVVSIIKHAANLLKFEDNAQLEDLMMRTVWHFDRKYATPQETHKASYTFFKKAVEDPSVFDECNISEDEKREILGIIKNRMTPSPDEIRADFKVRCTGPDGINAIRSALKFGVEVSRNTSVDVGLISEDKLKIILQDEESLKKDKHSNSKKESGKKIGEEMPINELRINLLSSPSYVAKLKTLDREKGLQVIKAALKAISNKITEYQHGSYDIISEPKLVGRGDDEKLRLEMERAAAETRQVPADDAE